MAKIFGPLLFGRGWCGYACWTAVGNYLRHLCDSFLFYRVRRYDIRGM